MKTNGHVRDATTAPDVYFGERVDLVDRVQVVQVMTLSTPVSIPKRTPIVCAPFVESASDRVDHGQTRIGSGADAVLLEPRRLA